MKWVGLLSGESTPHKAAYQILCAMRGQSAAQCRDVAGLAARTASRRMGGVVAMDLAGDESHFPNAAYVGCLRAAKLELGLNTTVHAGEFGDTSPEEVRSAVLEMGADRIGHGDALLRPGVCSGGGQRGPGLAIVQLGRQRCLVSS